MFTTDYTAAGTFRAILIALLMLAPGAAHAAVDAQHDMMMRAFVALKKAEAYDKVCNGGKVTGRVKERGHTANFDLNRKLLADELTKGYRATTRGTPQQVDGILHRVAAQTEAQMTAQLRNTGCHTPDAKTAEKVLNLFSRTEPHFLFDSLKKYIAQNAGQ